jgi:two-component system sensor histidine kinase KdpD
VQDPQAIAQVAATRIGKTMRCDCTIMLRKAESLQTAGQFGASFAEDAREHAVARWVADHGEEAGAGTATLPTSAGRYLPLLIAGDRTVGVVAMKISAHASDSAADDRRLVDAMIRQAATAIERSNLVQHGRDAWNRVQQENLRNTLLSAVSHDLRTPLTAITGSASALSEDTVTLSEPSKRELAQNILAESQRMERVISNLLEITRIESGEMTLKIERVRIDEVAQAVLARLGRRLEGREVKLDLPGDLPDVQADPTSLDQVLSNLIENAIEHTPAGTPIEIDAVVHPGMVEVAVKDRGRGLPHGSEDRVFEKFVRFDDVSDRRGLGLGLAICKTLIEAQRGTISAHNRDGRGAEFRFALPRADSQPKS